MEAGSKKKEISSDPSRFPEFVRTTFNLLILGSASKNMDFGSQGVKDCWEAAAVT